MPVREVDLIQSAQQGDRNAFGELVQQYARGVTGVAYRMCGNQQQAEDAAQETFLRAWVNLHRFDPYSSLKNWLYRIVFNVVTDMYRKDRRLSLLDLSEMPLQDPALGPERQVTQEERANMVQEAILALPEASRAVLILREYEGRSYKDISQVLDIPLGTVMSRLNYARKRLKDLLAPCWLDYAEVENA